MYDRGKIVTGIVIGLLLFLFPVFYNVGKAAKEPDPELTDKAKQAKECVEPKAFMKTEHMKMLDEWRQTGGARQMCATTRAPLERLTTRAFRPPAWTAIPTRASSVTSATTTWESLRIAGIAILRPRRTDDGHGQKRIPQDRRIISPPGAWRENGF